MRKINLFAVLIILTISVISCGGEDPTPIPEPTKIPELTNTPQPTNTALPEPTPTPEPTATPVPLTAIEIMEESTLAMSEVESYHYEMEMNILADMTGFSMEIPVIYSGDFKQPDQMQGTMSMELLGMAFEFEMVTVDGVSYSSDPFTGQWQVTTGDEADISGGLISPDEIASIDPGDFEDLTVVGEENLAGEEVVHLMGAVPAEAFDQEGVEGVAVFDVEYWIGVEDRLLRKISLNGSISGEGLGDLFADLGGEGDVDLTMTMIMNFSNYGVEVEIEAPVVTESGEVVSPETGGVPVNALAFSPDGQWLASGGNDNNIYLWDLADMVAEPLILEKHTDWVGGLSFSPDSQILASASDDLSVLLWNMADLSTEPVALLGHEDWVKAVAISNSGNFVASGGDDMTVRVWELSDPTEPLMLTGHDDWVNAIAFSPDGAFLASASDDGTILVWQGADITAEPIFLEGSGSEKALAFSPDSQTLASGSTAWNVELWNMADPTADPELIEGHEDWVRALAYSPDGTLLASAGDDQIVYLWDTETLELVDLFFGHTDRILALAYSPDGQFLASAGDDGTVRLWTVADPLAEPLILIP